METQSRVASQIKDEIHQEETAYSLVKEEDHPFWRYLYQYGYKLPMVSTVYGNAVFQTAGKNKHFLIYVSPSGFVAREKVGEKEIPLEKPSIPKDSYSLPKEENDDL